MSENGKGWIKAMAGPLVAVALSFLLWFVITPTNALANQVKSNTEDIQWNRKEVELLKSGTLRFLEQYEKDQKRTDENLRIIFGKLDRIIEMHLK